MNPKKNSNDKVESISKVTQDSKNRKKGKSKRVKIVNKTSIVCEFCNTPITNKNKPLICKECNINFCERCESKIKKEETYYDGFEKRKLSIDYPLCENCYSITLKKQKDLLYPP